MRPSRTLSLHKERLAPLTTDELDAVVGAATLAGLCGEPFTRYGQGACAHTAFDCLTRACE